MLTCAMRPYKFTNSDASFNIGTAVGAANCLNPGIYIAMGGCIFPTTGVFVMLAQEHSLQCLRKGMHVNQMGIYVQ